MDSQRLSDSRCLLHSESTVASAPLGKFLQNGTLITVTNLDGELEYDGVCECGTEIDKEMYLYSILMYLLKRYRLPDPCIAIIWRIVQEPGSHRCDGGLLFRPVVDNYYGDDDCVICGFPCVDADINDSRDMNCIRCRPCFLCLYCTVSLPAGCLKRNQLKNDEIATAPFAVCLDDLHPDELVHLTAQERFRHGLLSPR
jgi:hypothetical protein